jgi:hypothetical protein
MCSAYNSSVPFKPYHNAVHRCHLRSHHHRHMPILVAHSAPRWHRQTGSPNTSVPLENMNRKKIILFPEHNYMYSTNHTPSTCSHHGYQWSQVKCGNWYFGATFKHINIVIWMDHDTFKEMQKVVNETSFRLGLKFNKIISEHCLLVIAQSVVNILSPNLA